MGVSAHGRASVDRYPTPDLVHYSDRGMQYAGADFASILQRPGMVWKSDLKDARRSARRRGIFGAHSCGSISCGEFHSERSDGAVGLYAFHHEISEGPASQHFIDLLRSLWRWHRKTQFF